MHYKESRRNPQEAFKLAQQLEYVGSLRTLYLDDGEVQSCQFYPTIDYRRDSLQEISEKQKQRHELYCPEEPK